MTTSTAAKVGFISPMSTTGRHYDGFRPLVPAGVQLDIQELGLRVSSLYDFQGNMESILTRAGELVREHRWEGVIVAGAPVELMNPGLTGRLEKALPVPVTTAMTACITALKAYSARRVLLLTPFDDRMNGMLRDRLASAGLEPVSPPQPFKLYTDAAKLDPEGVFTLAKKAFEGARSVQAIYFQGGILDPLKVMDRLEAELGTTVVASNPSMLWHILSRMGRSYQVKGVGKLLREWPGLPKEAVR
jgi:maleate isomerase